jgi:hypothetical protein
MKVSKVSNLPIQVLFSTLCIAHLGLLPACAKEQAWRVDYNFHDWGDLDALVMKDRVHIKDKLRSWVMILNQPGWQITCYSPQRKTIATLPLSAFRKALGERLGIMTASDVDPTHWKKVGPATINGIRTTRYDQIIDTSDPRKPTAQCYVAADVPVDPQVAKFLCKFYDMPNFGTIPIRMTKRKIEKFKLDTGSIKPDVYKASDFAIPKGYKTKTLEEVMFAQTSFY